MILDALTEVAIIAAGLLGVAITAWALVEAGLRYLGEACESAIDFDTEESIG